jgi:hypothetical protein
MNDTEDQTFSLYGAATPSGKVIGSTVRQTPDDAWRALRQSVTEPDALIDRGWHVRRCTVIVRERLEDAV